VEEGDESIYWLEIFNETDYCIKDDLPYLLKESDEIIKIAASIKNTMFECKL
jgi:hypothetical protein